MKGKTILLILILVFLFGISANATEIGNSEKANAMGGEVFATTSFLNDGGFFYEYEWLKGGYDGFSDNYDVYPVYLINGEYSHLQNGKVVALFFVSNTEKVSKFSYRSLVSKDGTPSHYGMSEVNLNFSADVDTLWDTYDNNSSVIDWQTYLKQFLKEKGTIENMKQQLSGKYFAIWTGVGDIYGTGWEDGTKTIRLQAGQDISKGIVTMRKDTTNVSIYYCAPFLYVPPGESKDFTDFTDDDDDSGGDDGEDKDKLPFIAYCNTERAYNLLDGVNYTAHFTWKVEDYPTYDKYLIELRVSPSKKVYKDSPIGKVEPYYIHAQNGNQLSFLTGKASGKWVNVNNHYFNKFEQIMNALGSTGIEFYDWEIRVVSPDGLQSSNWVRYTIRKSGGIVDKSDGEITDDDGNVDGEVKDDEKYDPTIDNDVDISTNEVVNFKVFTGWIKDALSAIGQFPTFIATCFAWIPSYLITSIGIGIGFILILRLLGR